MKMKQMISLDEVKELKSKVLQNILDNNPARVKQLCYSVGKLFSKTNDLGKTYINNLFILPVTLMIEADFKNRKQFLNLFPMNLKSEYVKQIYHSGI
ncbi:hypothetical protein [Empedobacter sedimenti]|uniref:hypothetical protein n=1 Tax=Empedobacter sedimenti TaxID=3042610 RepID=UPI0024A62313|nr:hypothetical protein [Empedobacter sedimenti]